MLCLGEVGADSLPSNRAVVVGRAETGAEEVVHDAGIQHPSVSWSSSQWLSQVSSCQHHESSFGGLIQEREFVRLPLLVLHPKGLQIPIS